MTSSRKSACLLGLVACLVVLAAAAVWRSGLPTGPEQRSGLLLPTPEQTRVIQARIEAKEAVADRLLAGELVLLEAAAWFRRLNDNPPEYRVDAHLCFPGNSDGEKLCRQVIEWARHPLKSLPPESRAEALGRLEDELGRLLAEGAEIELPW
jgi:hypothetical protein